MYLGLELERPTSRSLKIVLGNPRAIVFVATDAQRSRDAHRKPVLGHFSCETETVSTRSNIYLEIQERIRIATIRDRNKLETGDRLRHHTGRKYTDNCDRIIVGQ